MATIEFSGLLGRSFIIPDEDAVGYVVIAERRALIWLPDGVTLPPRVVHVSELGLSVDLARAYAHGADCPAPVDGADPQTAPGPAPGAGIQSEAVIQAAQALGLP